LIIAIIAILAGGVGYRLGLNRTLMGGNFISPRSQIINTQEQQEVDFSLFWLVWDRLEQNYLDPSEMDAKEMVYGAIKGMTAALGDPYTSFLPPTENTTAREDLQGEFGGVGIQLGYIDETLAVMSPLPNNPAIEAGVKAGDLILHLEDEQKDIDEDTRGMSLPDAVSKIRGPVGSTIVLTVFTPGDTNSREVELVRANIVVPSIELTFVNELGVEDEAGRYAHLSVVKFGERTAQEWDEAVVEILRRQPAGIVLDLRNNPGGYLQRAIDLASEFISEGVVVQQQGRFRTETFSVNRRGRLINTQLVVLVNKGSASASEILAGALRDRLGAKLVGENTFGKGTVQDAQDLPGGAGLHVTIARWLLPSGANIHNEGIKPDVEVSLDAEFEGDSQLARAVQVLRGI
jgi:carboxyl-terminal processing protease